MEIRENLKNYIITPLSPILNDYESYRVIEELNSCNKNVALNMEYVQDCSIDFFEKIKEFAQNKIIGMYNVQADIFLLLNLMDLDKKIQIFVNEEDYLSNKRMLINRRFQVA